MKRSILMSLLVIGATVALLGGTLAYFSDTETVSISSNAGTMDLQVSKDNGASWHNGLTWSTPAAWAPGDTATLIVDVRNVGSSGALILGVGGETLVDTDGLADVIHITEIDATEFLYDDWMGAPMSYWSPIFGDGDGILTLREFVNSPYSAKFFEGWPPLTTDYLDPNPSDVKRFKITFEFDPDAGNEYQGATASFDLQFTITDDPTLLGTG
jgi:predicted ribosomally synthesized peptide with SipW-like signal peptide